MALFRKGPTDRGLQKEIVRQVSNLDIRNKMVPAKSTLGKSLQNRTIKNFEKSKLSTLKDISRKQQGLFGRAAEAATKVATSLIASDTVREFNKGDSYKNSLAAWTKNISGNPNPDAGEEGSTQGGSTSELGG